MVLSNIKIQTLKEKLNEYRNLTKLEEALNKNIRKVGRFKVVKIRIRKGKVLRNKKVSAKKGFEISHGKLKKMTFSERRNRKLATRKARIKIRSKLSQSIRKRQFALKKRKALGG